VFAVARIPAGTRIIEYTGELIPEAEGERRYPTAPDGHEEPEHTYLLTLDVERVIDAKAKGLGIPNDEMRKRLLASVSLGVMVTAQDVANTALFLASDAGKHISGQSISVCGGVRYMV